MSNDIIEGAARLMKKTNDSQGNDSIKNASNLIPTNTSNNNDLKQMIRDVVRDTVRDVVKEELQSAGLLSESTQNTNETFIKSR